MLKEFIQALIITWQIFVFVFDFRLPNLLHSIIKNGVVSSIMQRTYNDVKYCLIKFLISTFSLSAENIVFLSGEWKLVGLIIIKMQVTKFVAKCKI